MRGYRGVTILLVALATVIGACGGPDEALDLDGTGWVLTSLSGDRPLEDTQITLAFEDGVAGGFAGCNAYGAHYTTDGDALSIDSIESTAQACLEPEGVMEQESAYGDALWNVVSYQIADNRLELLDESGEVKLVYSRQELFEGDPARLVGTAWQLVTLDGSPFGEGMTYTIGFEEDRYTGLAGCRHFEGDYQVGDGEIAFLSTSMVEAECPDAKDDYYVREGQFTDSLTWARHWRIRDDRLEIHTAQGGVLVFETVP
jgi:heat shock protein HslJ